MRARVICVVFLRRKDSLIKAQDHSESCPPQTSEHPTVAHHHFGLGATLA